MGRAPLRGPLGFALLFAPGLGAVAADDVGVVYTIETGATREYQVEGFDRVLTWDEARIQVVASPPYSLTVTAEHHVGPTLIYVQGADGVEVVVIEVVAGALAPVSAGTGIPSGPGWQSRTSTWASGRGADFGTVQIREELTLRGDGATPWQARGEAVFASGAGTVMGYAQASYEDARARAFLGRTTWMLASGAGVAPLDAVEGAWRRGATFVGARVGAATDRFLAVSGAPVLAEVSGAWAATAAVRPEAAVWTWFEPTRAVLPGARFGVTWRAGTTNGMGHLFWSGRGGGFDGAVRVGSGPLSATLQGWYASRGTYVPGTADSSRWWATTSASWRVVRSVSLVVGLQGSEVLSEVGDRRTGSGWVGASVLPWRGGQISGRYSLAPSWTRGPSRWERLGAAHTGTLDLGHRSESARAWWSTFLLSGTGAVPSNSLQSRLGGQWRVGKLWWPGATVLVSSHFGRAKPATDLRVLLERATPDWSLNAWAGVGFAWSSPIAPGFSVGSTAGVRFARRHRLTGGVSLSVPAAGAVGWTIQLGYAGDGSLVASDRVPFGGRLTGVLFEDLNGDGDRGEGEPPVRGVPIELDGGERVSLTDDRGRYRFPGVGSEAHALAPRAMGWAPTGVATTHEVRSLGRTVVDIGVRGSARIVGRPFVDEDGDGQFDTGEALLPSGRIVVVDARGEPVGAADRTEGWEVSGVPSGFVVVRIELADVPAGYVPTTPTRTEIETRPGSYAVVPFAFRPLRSVAGRVLVDADADGRAGPDDPPVAGVVVRCDGRTATTDDDGRYILRDLPEGVFQVESDGVAVAPSVRFGPGPREVFGVDLLIGEAAPEVDARPPRTAPPSPDAGLSLVALVPSTRTVLLTPGGTTDVALYASWSDGSWRDVAPEAAWTTSDPAVATVEAGAVVGVVVGKAVVTASWQGREVTMGVDVDAVHVVGLMLSAQTLDVPSGGAARLTVRAILTTGAVEDVTTRVEWTTSDPSVASVSADGTVIGLDPGTAEVRATLRGVQAFPATVLVRPP